MSNLVKTPKPFPNSCSQTKLKEMYCLDMSIRQIEANIKTIIIAHRGLDCFVNGKNGRLKHPTITPAELKEFRETYGLPTGYEL